MPAATNPGAFSDDSSPVRGWVVIGGAEANENGAMSQSYDVDTRQPFAQLLVKAVDGAPEIEQIQIEYDTHETRLVPFARRLAAGEGQVIELREKRPIAKIVVYTDPDSSGRYIVFGS
jgi:hypothetical protein